MNCGKDENFASQTINHLEEETHDFASQTINHPKEETHNHAS